MELIEGVCNQDYQPDIPLLELPESQVGQKARHTKAEWL